MAELIFRNCPNAHNPCADADSQDDVHPQMIPLEDAAFSIIIIFSTMEARP